MGILAPQMPQKMSVRDKIDAARAATQAKNQAFRDARANRNAPPMATELPFDQIQNLASKPTPPVTGGPTIGATPVTKPAGVLSGTPNTAAGTPADFFSKPTTPAPPGAVYKKGGYVNKDGKLNLGSGRVSTTSKNKSNSNW